MITSKSKTIVGTNGADDIAGGGGADSLSGLGGNDRLLGGSGSDALSGGGGDDLVLGDAGRGGVADLARLKISEDYKGSVTFEGESAGYKNALGIYKIASDGTIYDVDVIWANASLVGSDGDLVAGKSTELLDLKAGERYGFFVVPDAYSQSGMAKLLADAKAGWKFVDAKGNAGNVDGGKELKLVHVAADGKQTDIKSAYGTSVFHSADDGSKGLNGDGLNHVVATADTFAGTLKVGFEDLKGGGDKDYDDGVFTFKIGTLNTALTGKIATTKPAVDKHDKIDGGDGNDMLVGMSGNDTISGGDGNDKVWGGTGNDVLSGGEGDDTVEGGSGDDLLVADAGDDVYAGGQGFDTLDFSSASGPITADLSKHVVTGEGNDQVSGVEALIGSTWDDVLKGDKNANLLDGGAGDDVLRGMGGADTLTGGDGRDVFQWLAKDIVDSTGNSLGVDVVTDFGKDDVLDLSKLFGKVAPEAIDDVVKVVEDGSSSHLYATIDGKWHEVATLSGVTGMTAADMLHDGMLLV